MPRNPPRALPPPGSLGAWLLAIRPPTLVAAVVPVAIGSACAALAGGFRLGPALAALTGALLLQVIANLANDLFDYERGADTEERLGPARAVQSGLLSRGAVRSGIALVIALALLVGSYLVAVAGLPVLVIGLCSILAALAYTGGPFPLGYNGLGEVFVIVFFGFVAVCGTTFVQLGVVPPLAWLAAVPPGLLASGLLVVNNVRDRATDRRAGKRTLAVRWGRGAAEVEYAALLLGSYAAPLLAWGAGLAPITALLPLATFAWAGRLWIHLHRDEGRALNRTLYGTAQLTFGFGLLLAFGIAWGAIPWK